MAELSILPRSHSSLDINLACRRAFTAFCRGEYQAWDEQDLRRWLAGPYANVATLVLPPGQRPSITFEFTLDDLGELLRSTWQSTTRLIESLAYGGGVGAIEEAFDTGSVIEVKTVDAGARTSFVPIHRDHLTLAQRVQSLVVADYLQQPDAYRGDVMPCEVCRAILIGDARTNGICFDHYRESGIRAK